MEDHMRVSAMLVGDAVILRSIANPSAFLAIARCGKPNCHKIVALVIRARLRKSHPIDPCIGDALAESVQASSNCSGAAVKFPSQISDTASINRARPSNSGLRVRIAILNISSPTARIF
jgi:hypothetical protein